MGKKREKTNSYKDTSEGAVGFSRKVAYYKLRKGKWHIRPVSVEEYRTLPERLKDQCEPVFEEVSVSSSGA